jgi:hypothetical protein
VLQGEPTRAAGQAAATILKFRPRDEVDVEDTHLALLKRRGREARRRLVGPEGDRYADDIEAVVRGWPIRVIYDLAGKTTDALLSAATYEELERRRRETPGELLAFYIELEMAAGGRRT